MGKLTLVIALGTLLGLTVAQGCTHKYGADCAAHRSCVEDAAGGTSGGGGAGDGGAAAGAASCDAACGGAAPVCDGARGECVGCAAASGCDEGVCDPGTGRCVGCLDDGDCATASAPRCDGGECKPCASDAHCAGVTGKPLCDTATGACVECTAADESACGDKSCDPATQRCTDTERGSRARCQSCVADSECQEDYRCVPMEFRGEPREGGYCLKIAATGCSEPLAVPTPARVSLSGAAAAVYCGVSESRTTCEAVLDLLANRPCPGGTDEECGVAGLDDARCETVNFVANRCTYACDASNQCPNTFACGNAPSDYCGAAQ